MNTQPSGQFISNAQAIEMTTLYRNQKENILKDEFKGLDILATSETFDRSKIDILLARQGCAALRIYYGMSNELKVHSLIVGVNASDEDMLDSQDNSVLELGLRCPPICPTVTSPLNP